MDLNKWPMNRWPAIDFWGVYSVWWRHAKVYQTTWLVNCIPPVSEPIIYLTAFGLGLTPLIGEVTYGSATVSYARFLAPGMIAVGVLFQAFFEGAYGSFIRLNYQKTWQALLTAPLGFMEVFWGDWLWAATKGMIAGVLTGLVAAIAGLYSPVDLLISLPILLLGSLLFGAMGLLMTGIIRKIDQINVPIFVLIIPMFTLCGTYFPRDTLPLALRTLASLLPLAAFVDLLRWPISMPTLWPWNLAWLALWLVFLAKLASQHIYPRLFR